MNLLGTCVSSFIINILLMFLSGRLHFFFFGSDPVGDVQSHTQREREAGRERKRERNIGREKC